MVEETIDIEEKEKKKKKKKEHSKMTVIIIIILLAIALGYIYLRYIATSNFIVKEYNVTSENLPKNFNGLKIAHLSDIHYATVGKEKLDKIVDEVNTMKPDIVFFTGDLHDRFTNFTDDMKDKIISSLSRINAPLGKYAIKGNHDYEYEGYEETIIKCGFTLLSNESKLIYYNGDDPIEIAGFTSTTKDEPNYNIELTNNYKIGLIHEGDAFNNIKDKNFDLVLAGHSHGGQVRLPFVGALKFALPDGAKIYYDEHYKENNTDLYISFGLGEAEYPIRAFNKPSFNFYRLYSKK